MMKNCTLQSSILWSEAQKKSERCSSDYSSRMRSFHVRILNELSSDFRLISCKVSVILKSTSRDFKTSSLTFISSSRKSNHVEITRCFSSDQFKVSADDQSFKSESTRESMILKSSDADNLQLSEHQETWLIKESDIIHKWLKESNRDADEVEKSRRMKTLCEWLLDSSWLENEDDETLFSLCI